MKLTLQSTENNALSCDICKRTFTGKYRKQYLKNHEKVHLKKYKCELCDSEVKNSAPSIAQHKMTHEINRKIFQCEICQKEFFSNGILKKHKEIHAYRETNREKNIKCDICDKLFHSRDLMVIHKKVQHIEERKVYKCQQCGKECFDMKKHNNRCHSSIEKAHSCDICEKPFSNKSDLKFHLQIHNDFRKTFPCDKCNVIVLSKIGLKIHLKIHEEERETYSCDICGAQLSTKSGLLRHRKTHDKFRKMYQCKYCGKEFTASEGRNKHEIDIHIQAGMKHRCDVCDKYYSSEDSLKKHKKNHCKDRKMFTCDICQKEFVGLSALKTHKKYWCGKQLRSGMYLQNHLESHDKVRKLKSNLKRHQELKHDKSDVVIVIKKSKQINEKLQK